MDTGLEALATALYVTVDDLLKDHPEVLPPRPQVGITAVTSDAEIITLAVVQACWATPARPAGYAASGPIPTCAPCSPECRASPATTSASTR